MRYSTVAFAPDEDGTGLGPLGITAPETSIPSSKEGTSRIDIRRMLRASIDGKWITKAKRMMKNIELMKRTISNVESR